MGKSIIIKGADFSEVALASINLFDPSQVRRNYAVYAPSDSGVATVKTYDGFCTTPYILIPEGAKKIHIVSPVIKTGSVRYRFTTAASDSEEVPQGTGLAGLYGSSSTTQATINVPSNSNYIYFCASIYRGTKAEASTIDLSGVTIEALF